MGMRVLIQPDPILEGDPVDDQRISLPFPDVVAVPRRIGIGRVTTAVQIDLVKSRIVVVVNLDQDLFRRYDTQSKLEAAMAEVARRGAGAILYLRQEGRGIGLGNKIRAYALQEQGHDTVDANRMLGFEDDGRTYDVAAAILRDLGVRRVALLTNNPKKVVGLEGYGIQMVEQVPIRTEANPHNAKYLETKKTKMGHTL